MYATHIYHIMILLDGEYDMHAAQYLQCMYVRIQFEHITV
jgi:hypothetical protein